MIKTTFLQKNLLAWYDRHRRVMPWRAAQGKRPNPYHVWLSEIMLQQTTVVTVGSYFEKFIQRWPTVESLAAAELDDVLAAWAGLGYYARARNLHKCAREVSSKDGKFPQDIDALMELPGIGPYTAAAISSIAFDRPAVAVDGNVERVVSRFFAQENFSKKILAEKAAHLAAGVDRPGDFTQAFMELGATVCTPRSPKCAVCPWIKDCSAHQQGRVRDFPPMRPKKSKPLRHGRVYWIRRKNGDFWIEKREGKGLYQGMYQLPTSHWSEGKNKTGHSPVFRKIKFSNTSLQVRHVFTHFDLVLEIWSAQGEAKTPLKNGLWISPDQISLYALPSLMKKVIRLSLGNL